MVTWSYARIPEIGGLTCGAFSALSGTDRDARCSNFRGRMYLNLSHPIFGHVSNAPTAECGPGSKLWRSLDERRPSPALLPIPGIIFLIGLRVSIAIGSPTFAFWLLKR